MSDSEGNAVISVVDCRNSSGTDQSYTAYKVSPSGEMLWGEDGIAISDPLAPTSLAACMNLIELEDHSYVFAWTEMDDSSRQHICLQRFNQSGVAQWGKGLTLDNDVSSYPYLVNSGENTFVMVYARTSSAVLYARKMDFEGESVWGKDVRIYRGGWTTPALQTQVKVAPSGDGGVLVSWNDDRNSTNVESPYLSYVTPDGKLGFAGQSDEADVKLSYEGWRCFNVAAVSAADNSCFYAVWRSTNTSQTWQGIMMQKLSREGELLWGDYAPAIMPMAETSLGYISVQQAGADGACAFFEEYLQYYDVTAYASRFDAEGNMVWPDGIIALTPQGRGTSNLQSQAMGSDRWLVNWTDIGSGADDKATTFFMTVLNEDGTLGIDTAGIHEINADNNSSLIFDGANIQTTSPDGSTVRIYNPVGAEVAALKVVGGVVTPRLTPGIYFANSDNAVIKFIIK